MFSGTPNLPNQLEDFLMPKKILDQKQSGFTLVEIVVATGIFVVVVSSILTLFTQVLAVNRRVQTIRELVQGTRAFTETIVRDVRNGRIDYTTWPNTDGDCRASNYKLTDNKSLALETREGEKLCFYLDSASGDFKMKKSGTSIDEPIFNSERFRIIEDTLRFHVFPTAPDTPAGLPSEVQPFVTIVAQFELDARTPGESSVIVNYQTTVSTDVYDTKKQD